MKQKVYKVYCVFPVLLAMTCCLILAQCDKMDIGYLKAENGAYEPKSVEVYRNLSSEDPHLTEGTPWTSNRIQGVSGTNPINYELYDVKVSDGGDAEAFKKAMADGHVRVQGSIIQLFQEGVNAVSNGTYTLTLRVYNEDHSYVLNDIFSFVVKDEEEFDWE